MNQIKGLWGEFKVKFYLWLYLGREYRVINNIIITHSSGKKSQIDHIVISRYGLFVIETKNYKGVIRIRPSQKDWIQRIGEYEYLFYNPIRQNIGHIYSLKSVTNLPHSMFINIVCFAGNSRFNSTSLAYKYNVVEIEHLVATIKAYNKIVLTEKQTKRVFDILRKYKNKV